jgi:hypothetical protein
MKTLLIRLHARKPRIERELKQTGFYFNAITQEWSKTVENDKANYWVKELEKSGLSVNVQHIEP